MINVLLYLFKHQLTDEANFTDNLLEIQHQLMEEGFSPYTIHQALKWLKDLQEQRSQISTLGIGSADSIRVWLPEEQNKLSKESLDFLSVLEAQGILTAGQREIIVERAMAISGPPIEVEHLKWIALIVLYYYQEEGVSISWVKHVLNNDAMRMH
jgi:Smg protein